MKGNGKGHTANMQSVDDKARRRKGKMSFGFYVCVDSRRPLLRTKHPNMALVFYSIH